MNEILSESVYFGVVISLAAYGVGFAIKKKWNYPIFNPLLIAMILVMLFLGIFKVDYETYDKGAKYITYFLTPATVCLAVPLYKQFMLLKKNLPAVIAGIVCGCITHALSLVGIAVLLKLDKELLYSLLPKSVTTPIALGICNEIGGIAPITVIGVCVAGIMGAVLGPYVLKVFHITNPMAQGLAIGTSSHALGTSKTVEMGEIQAAMSSLAIVVTGLLTVILIPIIIKII